MIPRSIRVAFANRAGAETGGAEESLALLIRYLPHDIVPHAILFGDGAYADRLRCMGVAVHIVPVAEKLLSSTREKPDYSAAIHLPGSLAHVRSLLKRERIDIVHTNTVKAHLIVVPAAMTSGVASVVHLRDMVPGVGKNLIRAVAGAATARIAISKAVSAWYGLSGTRVISNPVDISPFLEMSARGEARSALAIPNDLPLVSIVGRINRWKGHDRFLEIAARVLRDRDARFAIIGEARFRDEDFVPELHSLVTTLGIGDRVHFVPWQSDLRNAYAATDLLCNCSEREPFGRTIVEAAAAGVPSVAFDDGGAVDIIEDGVSGYVISAGNIDRFTEAITTALEPAELVRLSTGARARAADFEASRHAAQVTDIFREIATRRSQVSA